jgi:hypothetical protein
MPSAVCLVVAPRVHSSGGLPPGLDLGVAQPDGTREAGGRVRIGALEPLDRPRCDLDVLLGQKCSSPGTRRIRSWKWWTPPWENDSFR